MKTILGTGQLGLTIMDILLKNNPNEPILLVNKSGQLDIPKPNNVQIIAADVTNKNDMENIARQSAVIFSCTDVPYQMWGSFYPATASALAYALSKTDAKLVFADNLYSYGNVSGAVMNEEMSHKAETKKGLIRASVIQILLKSDKVISDKVAFVKAADFIGPRIYKGVFGTEFLDKLYNHKTFILSGNIALPHTFTYINDFAKAMINVGNAPDTFGEIWHVPNAPALNLKQWIRLFEEKTSKKAKLVVLPKGIVWIAGLFNSFIKELYELAYQYEYAYLVNHNKYVSRFGNHATSPESIVEETIEWYKSTLIN
jgi:nucleoside-diphosphate-sugar epimerase